MNQNQLPTSENAGFENSENDNHPKPIPGWLKVIAMFFAGIIYVFREPAIQLKTRVYDLEKQGFAWTLSGIFVSLVAGIGLGYELGWHYNYPVAKWVLSGTAAAIATYFYLWPAIVHVLLKGYIRLSEHVWKFIDFSLDPFVKSKSDDWLSQTVFFLTGFLTVGFACASFWFVMNFIHVQLAIGFAGYLFGGLAGLLVGVGSGFLGIALLNYAKLPWCAAVLGAILIYALRNYTRAYLPAQVFGFNITTVFYALELALWVGFIYPLLHITLTKVFSKFFKWLEQTVKYIYHLPKGGYREFYVQAINIASTAVVFFLVKDFFAPSLASNTIVLYFAASAVSLFVYVVFGRILNFLDNILIGGAVSFAGAHYVYVSISILQINNSDVWSFIGGVIGFSLFELVIFPIAFVAVKAVAEPLLSSWLREPLVSLHRVLSTELANSYDNTYKDKNENYIALFSQTASVAATVTAFFGARLLAEALELNLFLSTLLEIVIVVSAYLVLGKLVRYYKIALISRFSALAIAIYLGTQSYAFSSFHNIAYVIAAFGLILTLLLFFPISYVLIKALLTSIKADVWMEPVVVGAFEKVEVIFEKLWKAILINYDAIKATLDPMFENFNRAFRQSWEQISGSASGKRKN